MDSKVCKETFPFIGSDADWESISPKLHMLTSSPYFYLLQVVHKWQRSSRENFAEIDLTSTQFTLLTILVVLTKDGKVVTQTDLANFLKADKMMVSDVLRTLETKGYIVRKNHPTDRRAKSLIMTEKGITINEFAMKFAIQFNEQFFSPLGDEKEELIRLLKKLL